MGSANGDRSPSARKKRRGGQELTPSGAGEMLRNAREQLGIDLAEVHDRTGVSSRNLEALESGDVQRFSNPAAAAVAMRRYAELVELDPAPLVESLTRPDYALAGAPARGGSARGSRVAPRRAAPTSEQMSWAPAVEPNDSGHLRNYYDDSHLRSFTQTAQVPAVRGGVSTGPIPTQYRGTYKRKAPLSLRILTWLVLLLVVIGAGGIAVDHYEPQWLREAHILKSASPPKPQRPAGKSNKGKSKSSGSQAGPSTSTTLAGADLVQTASMGKGTASVTVSVSNYTIVVTASNACWVEASDQASVNPLVNRTLQPGQTVSIPVTGGQQMTVELGAAAGALSVEVGGQAVSGWSLKPNTVPFVTTFTSS